MEEEGLGIGTQGEGHRKVLPLAFSNVFILPYYPCTYPNLKTFILFGISQSQDYILNLNLLSKRSSELTCSTAAEDVHNNTN